MPAIEEIEMNAHGTELTSDLRHLVNKYSAIFGWEVPEVDETLSAKVIFKSLRDALEDLERPITPPRE